MSLRTKRRVIWVFLGLFCLLALCLMIHPTLWFLVPATICAVIAIVLSIKWERCPHCGACLHRWYQSGDYCVKCGEQIFLDETENKE